MDLRFLEDLLILLEEGSMNRAAARRHVTQPAFSRRIRAVENWVGIPLLERRANRVELRPSLIANEDEIKSLSLRLKELRQKLTTFSPERTTVTIALQHALIVSIFPEMAMRLRQHTPSTSLRLRAGNRGECISMLVRGDASILVCYEDEHTASMPFNMSVERYRCGTDLLIPVAGGELRHVVKPGDSIPEDTPAIVYPPDSYFGELLSLAGKPFAVRRHTLNPVCESAFSAGIKEMTLKGLGISWLPVSMVSGHLETGELVDLSAFLGGCDLLLTLYARAENDVAMRIKSILADPPIFG